MRNLLTKGGAHALRPFYVLLLPLLLAGGTAQAGAPPLVECGVVAEAKIPPRSKLGDIPPKTYRSEDGNEVWIGMYEDDSVDAIPAVAIASDGRLAASAAKRDRAVYVWDVLEFNAPAPTVLTGHAARILGLAISPDKKRLASASADKTVRIWSVASGQTESVLCGHEGVVLAVAFSPKGERVASGALDKSIRLWDLAGAREKAVLHGHTGAIRSLAFTPDGKQIVSGSLDGTVRVWNTATAALVRTLTVEGSQPAFTAVAVSPSGKLVAAGSQGAVYLWDLATGKQTGVLEQTVGTYTTRASDAGGTERVFNKEPVSAVSFSPKGDRVFVGFAGRIAAFDATGGKLLGTLVGSDIVAGMLGCCRFDSAAMSSDGKRVAVGASDLTVRVWAAEQIGRKQEDKLGSGETRCEGDACGANRSTLKPTFEDQCIWFANVAGRPIEVQAGGNGAEGSITLMPGEKKKLPVCVASWQGLGLYRASFRAQ